MLRLGLGLEFARRVVAAAVAAVGNFILTESGDTLTTEAGDTITWE